MWWHGEFVWLLARLFWCARDPLKFCFMSDASDISLLRWAQIIWITQSLVMPLFFPCLISTFFNRLFCVASIFILDWKPAQDPMNCNFQLPDWLMCWATRRLERALTKPVLGIKPIKFIKPNELHLLHRSHWEWQAETGSQFELYCATSPKTGTFTRSWVMLFRICFYGHG